MKDKTVFLLDYTVYYTMPIQRNVDGNFSELYTYHKTAQEIMIRARKTTSG